MNKVFDIVPFYDETDLLEIRLHELNPVVDVFIIGEAAETFGGEPKPFNLAPLLETRFAAFRDKIRYMPIFQVHPPCTDRASGRLREAYQRNLMTHSLNIQAPAINDIVLFSDLDEIPSAAAVVAGMKLVYERGAVHRFKQRSFYYNVNRLVDYGHDWASRARIGRVGDVLSAGGLYPFRMQNKNTDEFVVENGGWHFGYFGTLERIERKAAQLGKFLNEYQMFGRETLVRDIREGRDLHHRRCELPTAFTHTASDDPTLPAYFLANRAKFELFTIEGQLKGYL